MGLVDYSDSEDSGDEQPKKPEAPAPVLAAPAKRAKPSGFQRADVTDTGRINLDLPTPQQAQSHNAPSTEERPAKRAKTGLLGALPAKQKQPKHGGERKQLGQGLGKGVSLRTGAEPAFSRSAASPFQSMPADTDAADADEDTATTEDVTLTGKSTMFRPASLARKPQPGRPAQQATASAPSNPGTEAAPAKARAPQPAPAKPKISLFGGGAAADSVREPDMPDTTPDTYRPLLLSEDAPTAANPSHSPDTHEPVPQSQPQSSDLTSLAESMNLSPSTRRQLFGRAGAAAGGRVQQFKLADEYAANSAARAAGDAAPTQNAVRSIAPGKHSLQQLVSAANSQADALEDSFAKGRRAKGEVGGRYGWS